MIVSRLELKDTGEEIRTHESSTFPHTAYYVEPEKFPGRIIPWHWHEDVEVMYVVQGSMEIRTASDSYIVSAGDSVFLNTNVLHLQRPVGSTKVITLNQVFHASVIYGETNSIFYLKYVWPVLSCKKLDIQIFGQTTARDRKITELIRQAQDAADEQKSGYEIVVRNALSSMWLLLLESASEKIGTPGTTASFHEERLKVMMDYLHHHYMNRITLKEIACAANISERETIRIFNQILKVSPFTYLQEYRLRKATILLTGTQNSISQIAYDCGFGSASFFGKVFRQATGMTPSEYRKSGGGKSKTGDSVLNR